MTIRLDTSSEHARLLKQAKRILREIDGFNDRVDWRPMQWLPAMEMLGYIHLQGQSLRAALDLVLSGSYRDAYHQIRMVLEGYLTIRLITDCLLYPKRFKIRREQGDANLEVAKANFRSTVRELVRSGQRTDIIREWTQQETTDTITLILKGIMVTGTDGNPTGEYVPYYMHLWSNYDPSHHVLGKRIQPRRWLLPGWAGLRIRQGRELQVGNKQVYSQFFTIDGLVKHLRLNKILNQKTATRLFVHYNYLSLHTHNTSLSYRAFTRNSTPSQTYDHYHSELCLLYILHIAMMLLEIPIRRFQQNRINVSGLQDLSRTIQSAGSEFGYFWFLFNDPHEFDYVSTANRLSNTKKGIVIRPSDITKVRVRYSEDPLRRLIDLHTSSQELTTGNTFNSPFERRDARFR